MRDPRAYQELLEKRIRSRDMDPKALGRQIAEAQLKLLGKQRLEHHLSHLSDFISLPDEIKALYRKLEDRVLKQAIEGYKQGLEENQIAYQGNMAFLSFTSNYFASGGAKVKSTA